MQNVLVCFGDSFTKGKVFDQKDKDFRMIKESFPFLLKKHLPNVKIINAGVNDNTTVDALSRINNDVLSKRPTHVLILFGGNDVRIDWFKLILSKFKDTRSKVSLAEYKENLRKIISILKFNNICPIFLTLPPLNINKFLDRLSVLFGIKIVSVIKNHSGDKRVVDTYAKYNDAIINIAKNTKIPTIDLRKEFLRHKNWQVLISEDGAHPSSKGHRFIAKVIEKQLKQVGIF